MANKKKPTSAKKKAAQFKKGQSGNPNGRPKLSSDVKAVRLSTKAELAKCLDLLEKNDDELRQILKEGDKTNSRIIKMFANAIINNNWKIINSVLDRILGKAPQSMDHTSSDGSMTPEFKLKYNLKG